MLTRQTEVMFCSLFPISACRAFGKALTGEQHGIPSTITALTCRTCQYSAESLRRPEPNSVGQPAEELSSGLLLEFGQPQLLAEIPRNGLLTTTGWQMF